MPFNECSLTVQWQRMSMRITRDRDIFSIYLVCAGECDPMYFAAITGDGQILVLIIIKLLTSSSYSSAICQNLSQFIIHPTDLSVFEKLQRRKIYHGLVLVAVQIPKMCSLELATKVRKDFTLITGPFPGRKRILVLSHLSLSHY